METEWQFVADDLGAVRTWLEEETPAPFRVRVEPECAQRDEYWDTAGWLVWRAGFACRVRRRGEAAVLTLKGLSGGEGHLRRRIELNEPLDGIGGLAEATARPVGEAGRLLGALAGPHPLRPIAALTTHRTTLALSDGEGPLGEIALDRTTVGEGRRAHELLRVEVEVEEDALERAQPFVTALRDGAGLRPALSGKLAAALAAAGASPGWEPRPLGPMTIDRGSSLGDVAYAVMRRDFLRLVEHEPIARLGDDIEGVHQMRVASRRLRAALDAFREALPPKLTARRRELRWIGRSLGELRDFDVQHERLARDVSLIGRKAARSIETISGERRARAREEMLAALDSQRYVAFIDAMSDLLRASPEGGPAPALARESALSVAPAMIARWRRSVRRSGAAINTTSPIPAYHALRLKVKKLRYVLEFLAPLYGEPAETYGRQVTRLQTLLGDHQDAIVAAAFYRRLTREEEARLGRTGVRAAEELAANASVEAESFRWKFPKRYARLRGRRWHALKDAMSNS